MDEEEFNRLLEEEEELNQVLEDAEWIQEKPVLKSSVPEPKPEHLEALRINFGHSKFRSMQWDIIYSIIEKKQDGCVVMATGYGKSLCYQYPPVFLHRTALVVTPLISLMEDQTLALEVANIPACYLGAGQAGQSAKIARLLSGEYRVVYLTPEFCTGEMGQSVLRQLEEKRVLSLVAIDEAHCVSQWGHDFRHSYRKLGTIRQTLGNSVPILALTATATQQVKDDICSSLKLQNPFHFCSGFDRPNLYLAVHTKSTGVIEDLGEHIVERKGKEGREIGFGGPTIVYCPTKKATEKVCHALKGYGMKCEFYHADLKPSERKEVHHKFVRDEIQVIVATVAFGMGIDKPDVRLIIHYGAPKDMESYYQEVGRAGRDGLRSQCHCYYAEADFAVNQYFLSGLTGVAHKHRKAAMLKMEQYLNSRQCRRRILLSHFEPSKLNSSEKVSDSCCDNCTRQLNCGNRDADVDGMRPDGTFDFTEDSELLLKAVNLFDGRFGIVVVVTFLCGNKSDKIKADMLKHELYGKGKGKVKEWWRCLGRQLLQEGYLEEVSSKMNNIPGRFPIHTIRVAKRGTDFLKRVASGKGKAEILLYPSAGMMHLLRKKQRAATRITGVDDWQRSDHRAPLILPSLDIDLEPSSSSTVQPAVDKEEEEKKATLYKDLLRLRSVLAREHDYMPYMVATNKSLLQLATLRPTELTQLSSLDGFNAAKIQKFGKSFLDRVVEYSNELGLSLNNGDSNSSNRGRDTQNEDDVQRGRISSLPDTMKATYRLFQVQKFDIARIARERDLKESTIAGHLAEAIKAGVSLDVDRLGLTSDVKSTIIKAIRDPPVNSDVSRLGPIKENCPEHITWEQIKLTVALLLSRGHGLQNSAPQDSGSRLEKYKFIPSNTKVQSSPGTLEPKEGGEKTDVHQPLLQEKAFPHKNVSTANVHESSKSGPENSSGNKSSESAAQVSASSCKDLWEDDDLFAESSKSGAGNSVGNKSSKSAAKVSKDMWEDDDLFAESSKSGQGNSVGNKSSKSAAKVSKDMWEDDDLFAVLDLPEICQTSMQRKSDSGESQNVPAETATSSNSNIEKPSSVTFAKKSGQNDGIKVRKVPDWLFDVGTGKRKGPENQTEMMKKIKKSSLFRN